MKKQAKFFCENCGEEVTQNARFCKKCGRFFSAVRCPACGKVGSSHAFINGCPACGYAEKNKKSKTTNSSSTEKNFVENKKGHFYFHKNNSRNFSNLKAAKKKQNSTSLPNWVYIFTLIALIIMIILFIRCSY